MRRHALRFLVASMLAAFSTEAKAQSTQLNLWTQCTVTPFLACVHVELSAVYYADGTGAYTGAPNGVTEIQLKLENLDGRWDSDGYALGLKGLDLYGLTNQTGGTFVPQALGRTPRRVASDGNVVQNASMDSYNFVGSQDGLFMLPVRWDLDSYFFGCDVAQGASPFGGYDATCGGSITYSAFATGQLALSNSSHATLLWSSYSDAQTFATGYSGFATCTTGVDCVTVTPEPATLVLMGTGIATVFGVRRRRRKRD